jgi:hypothetical protein
MSEEIEEAAIKAEPNVTDKTGEWTSDGASNGVCPESCSGVRFSVL